jgi:purine-binding chemotaxis protein CheW
MDIAKIRKRLKDAEANARQRPAEDETVTKPDVLDTAGTGIIPERAESHLLPLPRSDEEAAGLMNGETGTESLQEKESSGKTRVDAASTPDKKTEEIIEILTFSLLKEDFAFRVSDLAEILRSQWITQVPNVPPYILGITSLRGKIIPVIDLAFRLSLSATPSDDSRKGKILIINGPAGPIGVTVDRVIGVIRIAKSEILPPPSHLSEQELKFIEGVAVVDKRFVSIINMEEVTTLHLF